MLESQHLIPILAPDGSPPSVLQISVLLAGNKKKPTNQISSQQVGDSVIWENQHTVTHVIVGVGGNEQEADPNLDFSVVPDPKYGRTYNPSRAQSEVKLLSFTLILSRSLSLSFSLSLFLGE